MVKAKRIAVLGVALGLILNAGMDFAAKALTVSTNLNTSAINLVNNVLGDGITATSASRTGTVYSFSGGAGTFGIDSGIMLDTSGRIDAGEDADLKKLMDYSYGGHTSTLEFELVSTGSLLNFNYVFASREFDQPVKYNDVFGLFVSVNGSAYENIALIERNDGKEVPVTINSLRAGVTGTEAPSSFTGYPVNGRQYSLFKGASVALNETVDGISNAFTAFKEVSVGDTVKVKFAIADVSDAKYDSYVMIEASSLSFEAPGARPNYFTEQLWNLDPETTYKITVGGVDYTVTTDANGETPIVTDDYDLFGHTIQITKIGLGQTAQTLKIAARPEPPDPVAGPDENYALPDTVTVTETSITVVGEDGQQYRIDDNMTWRDPDSDGLVVFSGLEPNVPHTVYTRYEATENHPASYESDGTEFSTLRSLDYTVQNYWGLYDGQPHSAIATSEVGTVYYGADARGEFSATIPEFTEVGQYPVYFLIKADGYYSVYGTLSVEIVGWEYDLTVSAISEVAEISAATSARERIEGYYEGVLNKVVGGEVVERVYEAGEALAVTATANVADGEYQVVVMAEDGTISRVAGVVANGILSFQTDKFGKYGLVVPLAEMVEGVDYTVQGYRGLYDGLAHSATVTSDGEVTYSATRFGDYGTEVIEYTEPGTYTTYFKIEKDGYVTTYGSATVEIVAWEYGLVVTEVGPVAELAGSEFYYAGEVNKMVDGEAVERVYATEEALDVSVMPEVEIEGQTYRLKDGAYQVKVMAEDGTISTVTGTAANGVLNFSTNQFGKYGVVVPHERPNAGVNYETSILTNLEARERYRICYGEVCVILTADEEGEVPLEGEGYDLYGQDVTITKIGIAQDPQELTVGWRTGLGYQATPWRGLYDGLAHAATVTGDGVSVKYADENGNYTLETAEFVEPGVYTVQFEVTKDGWEPVYGQTTVEVVAWEYGLTVYGIEDEGEAEFYYQGEVNKMVDGAAVERVVATEDSLEVAVAPEVEIEGQTYRLKDGEYRVVVTAEDGAISEVIGVAADGVLSFSTSQFGKYGVVVPHETPNAVVDYEAADLTELEAGERYKVCYEDGAICVILTAGEDGEVPLEGGDYDLYGQEVTITKIGIAQDPQELEVGWRVGLGYEAENFKGLYDGLAHSAIVDGDEVTVRYVDESGEYTLSEAAFAEPGVHSVRFKVEKEGWEPVYGEAVVEIVEWTAEDTTEPAENFGGAVLEELTSDELKEVLPITTGEEDNELVDNPEVKVWLTVEDATNTVTFEEMATTKQALLSSEEILAYFDVNLFKQVGTFMPEKIHETARPVRVTIEAAKMVDEFTELVAGGAYSVVRLHNGVAEKIGVVVSDGKISFETDQFSIYALARPVVSQEIDDELPELDPLGVIEEVGPSEIASTTGDEKMLSADAGEDLISPDTGSATKNLAVAIATYLPVVMLSLVGVMFMRKKHWAAMRRQAQASFNSSKRGR